MLKKCERGRGSPARHPAATREAVERAVRTEGLSVPDAARAYGLAPSTVRRWLAEPVAQSSAAEADAPAGPDPDGWSAALREAAVRVHDNPTVALRDWAVLLGWPPEAAARLAARCGLPARPAAGHRPPGWETAELGRRLRRHLGRQIAALDADLAVAPDERDATRILRDLGGLKRLFDDLGGREEPDGRAAAPTRDGTLDLAGLRATIARRAAAFGGGGPA